MERNLTAGLFHASATLGIAETAHQTATSTAAARGEPDTRTRIAAAEASIDLSACRAALARTAEPGRRPPPEQADARRHR